MNENVDTLVKNADDSAQKLATKQMDSATTLANNLTQNNTLRLASM